MPKRYRLLKDLPDGAIVGDVYEQLSQCKKYYNVRMYKEATAYLEGYNWETWQVENNPDWFEEIKEKERIEATITQWGDGTTHTSIITNGYIPANKMPLLKKAIESILNNEPIEEQKTNSGYVKVGEWTKEDDDNVAKSENNYTFGYKDIPLSGQLITLEECERREKAAFDAGRWFHGNGKLYPSFENYKQSKIKEKERIEVMDYELQQEDNNGHFHYTLKFNKYVNFNKDWPKIIESIESILNDEPIEEQKTWMFESEFKFGTELNEKITFPLYVNGVEFVPKPTDNQPLTGELITLEECERREEAAFYMSRDKSSNRYNTDKTYRFTTFEQYKQHIKHNKEMLEKAIVKH